MGGSSSDSKKIGMLSDEGSLFLKQIFNQIAPQVGQGVEAYSGQITPGASSLQKQGLEALSGLFGGETGGALSRMLSGESAFNVDPSARQGVYDAEKAMAMRQFQTEMMPMLEERFNAQGAGRSGGLERAGTQAAGDLSLGLGSLYSGLGYQDEQARRAGLESAAGRQGVGLGLQGQMLGQQMAGGQVQRGIQGEQLGEQYNKWLSSQPYMNPYMTQWAPMAFGVQPYAVGQETKSGGFGGGG